MLVKVRPTATNADLDDMVRQAGADGRRRIGHDRTWILQSRTRRADQLLQALARHPRIEYVEPDYVVYPTAVPNDPTFPNQWALRNPMMPGADVHAVGAWDIARGAANVVLGIIDNGLDISHRDLRDRLWSAPADFTVAIGGQTLTCPPGSHGLSSLDGELACDPMYRGTELHATAVTGVAAAAGNNGVDATGLNWSASVLPLTFARADFGFNSDAINAIDFAIQAKARFAGTAAGNIRVLSFSWGGGDNSQAFRDAIERAGANDILFVSASGNSHQNLDVSPIYPASFGLSNQLAVAATTQSDQLGSFSNYGPASVHLAAPGENIVTLAPTGGTSTFGGTSLATPFVSGAAALVLSRCPMNTAGVKALLLNSADKLNQLAPYTMNGARLNVETALRACVPNVQAIPPAVSLATPIDRATYPMSAAITLRAIASDTDGTVTRVDFYDRATLVATATAPPYTATWTSAAAGDHLLTAVATDDDALQTVSSAVAVTVAAAPASAVPSPWATDDVGPVAQTGSARASGASFLINGGGSGIAGNSDTFRFVYQWLDGDGEIVAHLANLDDSNPSARAGIMLRSTLDGAAAGVAIAAATTGDLDVYARSTDAAAATRVGTQPNRVNRWLKLIRSRGSLIALASPTGSPNDGTFWTTIASVSDTLPARAAIGLVVSSRDPSSLTMATFDGVAVKSYGQAPPLPFPPVVISPAHNAVNVSPNPPPTLTWSAGYATSYDVRFGTENPPPFVSFRQTSASYTPPAPLASNTRYNWEIVAYNSTGSTRGDFWSFVTGSPGSPLPGPWTSQDVGAVVQTGGASYSAGTFTVRGAGADIWGARDAFQFVSQPLAGDGQIVARVASLQNTNPYAKAGVMIRASQADNAAHVVLDVRPTGDVEFMTRAATGAATSWLGGATRAAPVWLSLVRTGTTIAASTSANGSTWTSIGTATLDVAGPVQVGLVVCSHDTGQLNAATFDNVTVSASVGGALPSPWVKEDVGAVGTPGGASFAASTFTVKGAGADIWGTSDAFQFVHQPLAGDGRIVARVTSLQNTHTFAKAGVMIRESSAPNAAHVILDVRPSGDIEFMTRTATGAATTWLRSTVQPVPVWLALVRTGTTIAASTSADGTTWTAVGNTTFSNAGSVEAGLVVCSHDTGRLNTATFDNVTVSGLGGGALPSPWTDQDVGAVNQSGSASYSAGTFAIKGGGADIWGARDAFHFVSQPLAGDGQIVARVVSLQNTNTFAKAGVMIRESLADNAAHVILDVRPNGAIEFMTRSANGAATTWLTSAAQAAPVWLMLTRNGATVTASMSVDGSTWTPLGSTTFNATGTVRVGLIVCSHDTAQLNTAAFDNVAVNVP